MANVDGSVEQSLSADVNQNLEELINSCLQDSNQSLVPWRERKLPQSFFQPEATRPQLSDNDTDARIGSRRDHPQRSCQPMASNSSNVINLETNEETKHSEILPPGWGTAFTSTGQKYYMFKNGVVMTWSDPRVTLIFQPDGWLQSYSPDGKVIYTNRITSSISFQHPEVLLRRHLPHIQSSSLPPLPPGWKQKLSPTGQFVFFNDRTGTPTGLDPRIPRQPQQNISDLTNSLLELEREMKIFEDDFDGRPDSIKLSEVRRKKRKTASAAPSGSGTNQNAFMKDFYVDSKSGQCIRTSNGNLGILRTKVPSQVYHLPKIHQQLAPVKPLFESIFKSEPLPNMDQTRYDQRVKDEPKSPMAQNYGNDENLQFLQVPTSAMNSDYYPPFPMSNQDSIMIKTENKSSISTIGGMISSVSQEAIIENIGELFSTIPEAIVAPLEDIPIEVLTDLLSEALNETFH